MGSITIRKLDDATKLNARQVAASKGRSLEAELRDLIERTYGQAESEHVARIKAMSNAELIDHLIAITRPGYDLELPEKVIDEDRDIFGAD
jgi:plasmid stability protein